MKVHANRPQRGGKLCQFAFVSSVLLIMSVSVILWQRWRILWWRWRISGKDEGFFIFLHLCEKPLIFATVFASIYLAYWWGRCLHWARADILMRGNPVTYMTDNTEDTNANWQCLHTCPQQKPGREHTGCGRKRHKLDNPFNYCPGWRCDWVSSTEMSSPSH